MKQTPAFTLTDNDILALKRTIEALARADDALFRARRDRANPISGLMYARLLSIGNAVSDIWIELEGLLAQVESSPSGQAGQTEAPGVLDRQVSRA